MKYLITLLLGMLVGAALFVAGLYFNPFAAKQTISPLALPDGRIIDLSFANVPAEMVLYTNNGQSVSKPHPARVQQLWESTVQNSRVSVVSLTSARGEPAGIGVKFASESEDTRPLQAKALVNSAWFVYLPGRGSLFVQQTENYWAYLRDIVVPARWSSSDSWRGAWHRITTSGPGALGTARVDGLSGEFAGLVAEAVESVDAKAYSAVDGPVGMTGALSISISPADTYD